MSQSGPSSISPGGALRFGTGLHQPQPPAAGQAQDVDPAPLGIVGDAGKGAVPNYGRRNRIVKPKADGAPFSEREKADKEFAAGYSHDVSRDKLFPR